MTLIDTLLLILAFISGCLMLVLMYMYSVPWEDEA